MLLEGSCHCQAVRFSVESHEPVPFMRCYCSICRKTAGTGGFAINLGADHATLKVDGMEQVSVYRATTEDGQQSSGQRHFCKLCGTALWLFRTPPDPFGMPWLARLAPEMGADTFSRRKCRGLQSRRLLPTDVRPLLRGAQGSGPTGRLEAMSTAGRTLPMGRAPVDVAGNRRAAVRRTPVL